MILYDTMPSPVGELLLTAEVAGLTGVYFEPHDVEHRAGREWQPVAAGPSGAAADILAAARAQLDAYFAGKLTTFSLPLAAHGTPFQQRVWTALLGIGFGQTLSYGELARRLGTPRAMRAVGGANGRNPIPVVVPCHRVIGADGSLTWFGGGIDRKRWLLQHEGAFLL
jgi:methylated-DNA-[protein]-cysteine S-methyltransferase